MSKISENTPITYDIFTLANLHRFLFYTSVLDGYAVIGEGICRNPDNSYQLSFGPVTAKHLPDCRARCNADNLCNAVELDADNTCYGFKGAQFKVVPQLEKHCFERVPSKNFASLYMTTFKLWVTF